MPVAVPETEVVNETDWPAVIDEELGESEALNVGAELTVIEVLGVEEIPPCATVTLAVAVNEPSLVLLYEQVNWLPDEPANEPPWLQL